MKRPPQLFLVVLTAFILNPSLGVDLVEVVQAAGVRYQSQGQRTFEGDGRAPVGGGGGGAGGRGGGPGLWGATPDQRGSGVDEDERGQHGFRGMFGKEEGEVGMMQVGQGGDVGAGGMKENPYLKAHREQCKSSRLFLTPRTP